MNANHLRAPLVHIHRASLILFAIACLVSACSTGSGAAKTDAVSTPPGGAPSVSASAGGGSIADGMLAAHNAARAAVMPAPATALAPLVWSSEIAAAAQTWANGCEFKHSASKYGENIFASAGANTSTAEVVDTWVSEAKDYDYGADSCVGTCGHYTQVVWSNSSKLGCAVGNCSTGSPFSGFGQWQFWVCNYDPPGNFTGQKPY